MNKKYLLMSVVVLAIGTGIFLNVTTDVQNKTSETVSKETSVEEIQIDPKLVQANEKLYANIASSPIDYKECIGDINGDGVNTVFDAVLLMMQLPVTDMNQDGVINITDLTAYLNKSGYCKRFVQVSAGKDFTCAITKMGKIHCWGKNNAGQLGIGNTTTQLKPKIINTSLLGIANKFKQVSAGGDSHIGPLFSHACAIHTNNRAYCWGSNNDREFGNNTTISSTTPVEVGPTSLNEPNNYKEISAGGHHTCAIHNNGQGYCWGLGNDAQLGQGDMTEDYPVPTRLNQNNLDNLGFTNSLLHISAGGHHGGAIHQNFGSIGWGVDFFDTTWIVNIAQGFKFVEAGGRHSCQIETNGKLYCFGRNLEGQIGIGTNVGEIYGGSPSLVMLPNGAFYAKDVSAGGNHTCAIDKDDKLYCWGSNADGELGTGNIVSTNVPVLVDVTSLGLPNKFKAVSSGQRHTCAFHQNDKLYCWGNNSYGQLGNNSTAASSVAVLVDTSLVIW